LVFIVLLMVVASFCYLINSFVNIVAPQLSSYLGILILLPALFAELSLALWLLFKGVNQTTCPQATPLDQHH